MPPSDRFQPTPRTTAKRLAKRAAYDKDIVHAILDDAYLAHVGFAADGQPFVLPMVYGRRRDQLFLHGSAGGRQMRALASGIPICVTVTINDGLVLARSSFNHSMNYRCVMVLGKASAVTDPAEKMAALKAISDHLLPARWEDARKPNPVEMKQTLVVSLRLEECSAKVRTGPPIDEDEDYALPVWAGIVPARTAYDAAIPDPRLPAGTPQPPYLRKFFPA